MLTGVRVCGDDIIKGVLDYYVLICGTNSKGFGKVVIFGGWGFCTLLY